jgi:hypothetical protein
MLDGIVLCYEMSGISILTPIRPEDVSVSVFLGICEDYHAVSDLKAGGTTLTDEETQDGTGEIPALTGDRLGFFFQKILNGGYPTPGCVSGDLFDGPA